MFWFTLKEKCIDFILEKAALPLSGQKYNFLVIYLLIVQLNY